MHRGVRVIELDAEKPDSYQTHTLEFKDLVGTKLHKPFKDFIFRHSPTCFDAAIPMVEKALAVLAAIIILIVLLVKLF